MRVLVHLICGVVLFFSLAFSEEDMVIESSGAGKNHDEAMNSAKCKAIETALIEVLLSQAEKENFQRKHDVILKKTVNAVKNYTIVSESKIPDGTIQIKIKATISKGQLKENLAPFNILIGSMSKPRIMVVVNESKIDNNESISQIAETAITNFLKVPYQFELIDLQTSKLIRNSKQKMEILSGNEVEAAAIGTQFGAEVLITGNATSKRNDVSTEDGMVSVQADVTLKAINCTNGRIIGSSSERIIIMNLCPQIAEEQAIAAAAKKSSARLVDAIVKDWQFVVNNRMPINLSVSKVPTFRMKNYVVQTIKGISGVSRVHEKNWDFQSGILILDVQYNGPTTKFCKKIDGFKMKTGGGSLIVTGINGQNILLTTQAM